MMVGFFVKRGVRPWRWGELKIFCQYGFPHTSTRSVGLIDYQGFQLERIDQNPLFVIRGTLFNRDDVAHAAPKLRPTLYKGRGSSDALDFEALPCCAQIPLEKVRAAT